MKITKTEKKARTLILSTAPVRFEMAFDRMKDEERREIVLVIGGIAERAAFLEGYAADRYGYGFGDRGHKQAVRHANSQARKVWMRVFGYNAHLGLKI